MDRSEILTPGRAMLGAPLPCEFCRNALGGLWVAKTLIPGPAMLGVPCDWCRAAGRGYAPATHAYDANGVTCDYLCAPCAEVEENRRGSAEDDIFYLWPLDSARYIGRWHKKS